MASKRDGVEVEWAKHLRPVGKRHHWQKVRRLWVKIIRKFKNYE